MNWNLLTLTFIALLAASTLLELWLSTRHIAHVGAHRNSVPKPFRRRISAASHKRSADYTIEKTRLSRIVDLYGTMILFAWTVGGGLEWLDTAVRGQQWTALLGGTVFLLLIFGVNALLELPVELFHTFGIEQRFGFNRMSLPLYAMDTAKKFLLLIGFGAPLAAAALWFMHETGESWWLYVWALWIGMGLFMSWAWPALIAPLFNRFRPLKDRGLRARLLGLLKRTGFRGSRIFVVDGSRRSSHGNAYFTGLGRTKRIVLFDNLIKQLRPQEIEAVVAHELGHFKLKHIVKRLALTAVMSFAGLAILGVLTKTAWFYEGLGMSQPSPHATLALFVLAGPVFTFFLQPLFAWGSRRHEYQADDFAARETNSRSLISALIKLYRDNAATLTPDPVYSAFYDSHPPAIKRIAHLHGK